MCILTLAKYLIYHCKAQIWIFNMFLLSEFYTYCKCIANIRSWMEINEHINPCSPCKEMYEWTSLNLNAVVGSCSLLASN